MSRESESAELILKLYDLRREDKMREARNWIISFFPESVDDVMQAMIDPDTSAKYRMVTTYWDMAASFVLRGAIDEAMFLDSSGEAWVVYAKVQGFVEDLRQRLSNDNYLRHLETLLMRQPNAEEICSARRETMKRWMAARAELLAAKGSAA
jgi:hypothetical protein